jgi:histidyl-tRNA synthetase
MYPSSAKLKKQMQYADKNNIEFVIIVGQNEIKTNTITVKKMSDSSQQNMSFEKLLKILK